MSIAITEAITTLAEANRRFDLMKSKDENLFPEWQIDLPELSGEERSALVFSPFTSGRELYLILQILKQIGSVVGDRFSRFL